MEARAREVPEVVPYVPLADPRPDFIKSLPDLTTEDVSLDDNCPICLISFETILKEAAASALDVHAAISNPSNPKAAWYNGVTKLDRCGHVFCKQDLVEWIQGSHGSCPTCRDQFLTLAIEEGYESSDGGEYIPPSDDTMDADDIELDGEATSDSFTDDMDMSDWGANEYSFSSAMSVTFTDQDLRNEAEIDVEIADADDDQHLAYADSMEC